MQRQQSSPKLMCFRHHHPTVPQTLFTSVRAVSLSCCLYGRERAQESKFYVCSVSLRAVYSWKALEGHGPRKLPPTPGPPGLLGGHCLGGAVQVCTKGPAEQCTAKPTS